MKQSLGKNENTSYPNVWSGLHQELHNSIDGIDFQDLFESVQKASMEIVQSTEVIERHDSHWESLGKNWLPRVSNLKSSFASLKTTSKILFEVPLNYFITPPHNIIEWHLFRPY